MNWYVDALEFDVDSFEHRLVNGHEIGWRLLNVDVRHRQKTAIVTNRFWRFLEMTLTIF